MFYISYLSISLFVLVVGFIFKNNSNRFEWIIYVICFFTVVILNNFGVINENWPAFHPADESYFYNTSLSLKDDIENGHDFIEALLATTWNYKYYGFIVFDYVSIYGAHASEEAHKLSIAISLSSIYLLFLRYIISKREVYIEHVRYILLPVLLYMCTLNYRDGFVSILIFFIFKSIYDRKLIGLILSIGLLAFFRVEFIQLLTIAFIASLLISMTNLRMLMLSVFTLFFTVLLILFNGKASFDVGSFIYIPLSFNGVSLIHDLFNYYAGEHYYQGNLVMLFLTVLVSLAFFIFKTFTIILFCRSYDLYSFKERVITNTFVIFYVISLLIYNFLLNGFQDRIKVAFVGAIVFVLSMLGEKYTINNNKFFIIISIMMTLFVLIRNVRWIF